MINDESISNEKMTNDKNLSPPSAHNFGPSSFGHLNFIRHLSFVIRHSPPRLALLLFLTFIFYLPSCAHPTKPATPAASPAPVDPLLLATDPCALRMQDIASAMLLYLNSSDTLPPTLEHLRPAAARVGLTLDFTCPVSHLPYVYAPNGLFAPGDPHHLVLYDPTPAHEGYRWAIAIMPPTGNHPRTADIVRLTDPMLKLYLQTK